MSFWALLCYQEKLMEINLILAVNWLFVSLFQYSSWTYWWIVWQYNCSIDWHYKCCADNVLIACFNYMLMLAVHTAIKGTACIGCSVLTTWFLCYFLFVVVSWKPDQHWDSKGCGSDLINNPCLEKYCSVKHSFYILVNMYMRARNCV